MIAQARSSRIGSLVGALLDLFFPPRCVVSACSRRGYWLCPPCLDRIRPLPTRRCPTCAELKLAAGGICPACVAHPPAFDSAFALGIYEGSLRDALQGLKYLGRRPLAALLARAAAQALSWADWPPPIPPSPRPPTLLALPCHPLRSRERGLDHADLLARELAQALGWPLDRGRLKRIRATRRQVGLSPEERRANLRGAFVSLPWQGEDLLLVDDVLTTGASADAAARALKAAGAGRVHVLAMARAAPFLGGPDPAA